MGSASDDRKDDGVSIGSTSDELNDASHSMGSGSVIMRRRPLEDM